MELEDTWETLEHLDNCLEKLQVFQQKFPRKPRDERDVSTLPNIWISNHDSHGTFYVLLLSHFPTGFFG